jgi:multiple sugar transport system substrate-binding protein
MEDLMGSTTSVRKRPFFFIANVLMILVLLAACGGANQPNDATPGVPGTGEELPVATATAPMEGDTPEPDTEVEVLDTPTAEETVVDEPTEDVTPEPGTGDAAIGDPPSQGLIRMAVVRGNMREVMAPLAQRYEQEFPGMTVELVEEPEGGAFEALIAAGNQPDIIIGSFGSMIGNYAEQNFLAPIQDMPGAQEMFDRVDEETVQQAYGANYYVPMGADVTVMIYNKELFEEAGLDPENPPATWDEFLTAAEQIQNLPARDGSTVYGTVFWNEALGWGGWYWNMLQPFYLNANQNSCQLLNRLGTDIVFDDPQCNMDAFFEFMQQAQQYAPPTMEQSFFSRTIGMWPQYGYSWEPNLETAAGQPMVVGEDVGIAPVPVPNAGDTSFTTYGGRPLMILRTTPEREQRAWHFIQYLMQDDVNLEILQGLGYLPTLNSLKDHEYFQDPARQPFVEALDTAIFPEVVRTADTVANTILGVYQESVVQNQMNPEQAVESAAQRARQAISQ